MSKDDVKINDGICQKPCLDDSAFKICKVDDCCNNEIIFVDFMKKNYCKQMFRYGGSFVCKCPTRKELFLKNRR